MGMLVSQWTIHLLMFSAEKMGVRALKQKCPENQWDFVKCGIYYSEAFKLIFMVVQHCNSFFKKWKIFLCKLQQFKIPPASMKNYEDWCCCLSLTAINWNGHCSQETTVTNAPCYCSWWTSLKRSVNKKDKKPINLVWIWLFKPN